MKNKFTEFSTLCNMCYAADMNIKLRALWEGMQVTLYTRYGEFVDDAVIHPFSHGWEQGLLETYILNDCSGFETAKQIFEGWQEMLEAI